MTSDPDRVCQYCENPWLIVDEYLTSEGWHYFTGPSADWACRTYLRSDYRFSHASGEIILAICEDEGSDMDCLLIMRTTDEQTGETTDACLFAGHASDCTARAYRVAMGLRYATTD